MNEENKLVKVKICGLKTESEIHTVAEYGAEWYGMIFVRDTPRHIDLKSAEKLVNKTPKEIIPVAVTVNPTMQDINEFLNIGITNIQLHGKESVSFCNQIKKEYNIKLLKAISLSKPEDVLLAETYKNSVEWILFDYKDSQYYGGTGKSFNWNILKGKSLNFNWILSGGLDYNNVRKAINITKACAVDVSSGVEYEKGKKSVELIKKFFSSVYEKNI